MDKMLDPQLIHTLTIHKRPITCLAFNPVTNKLYTASKANDVVQWTEPGNVYNYTGHTAEVMALKCSQDGQLLLSGSQDKSARLWSLSFRNGFEEIKAAHSAGVGAVDFTGNSERILTGSHDRYLKLWDTSTKKFIRSFGGHHNWVTCAKVPSDKNYFASGSLDKTAQIFDMDTGNSVHTFEPNSAINDLDICSQTRYLALGLADGKVKIYDFRTLKLVQRYRLPKDECTQVKFHPSSKLLVCAAKDSMVVLDLVGGVPLMSLVAHDSTTALALNRRGDTLASGGADGKIYLFKTNFDNEILNSIESMSLGDERCGDEGVDENH